VSEGLSAGKFFGEHVKSCSLEGFKVSELVYSHDFQGTPPHFHEHSLMKGNLGGTFTHSFGNKAAWVSVPGTMDYCPSGMVHWHTSHRSRVRLLVIEVHRSRLGTEIAESDLMRSPVNLRGERCRWLLAKLYRGFNEVERDSASRLEVEGVFLMLLSDTMRTKANKLRTPPWLHKAREIVHERFRESLTLKEIAQTVDVHPAWLASAFHRAYHQTVGDTLRHLRVDYASSQLRETNKTLAEIALEAGFSDQSHFSNVFRRLVGSTPTQYRRNSSSAWRAAEVSELG
jgi:AraC family transcriptional regulator